MEAYHDSYSNYFRTPFGAVKIGENIHISIKLYYPWNGIKVYLCVWDKDERYVYDMHCDDFGDECTFYIDFEAPKEPTLLWYHFIFENYDGRLFYGNNQKQLGGVGQIYDSNPVSYQITIYKEDKVPEWYKEGIVYQIFPDRFFKGKNNKKDIERFHKYRSKMNRMYRIVEDWNEKPCYEKEENGDIKIWDFYGGTLEGVIEKLPYLKELNVSVIYFNPIFEARSNHRYDTADYFTIDPLLGDEATFDKLIKEAKKYGIHIIFDGVFSHTGVDSKYFNKYNNYDTIGAYNSDESDYYNWYTFGENKDKYECWWGIKDLPCVKEITDSYQDMIYKSKDSVIRHWMKKGLEGWRLDVADELPDSFIEGIRKTMMEENKDSILIGEVWEDASNKISYGEKRKYLFGNELQSIMNYPYRDSLIDFMRGKINSDEMKHIMMHYMENYPKDNFYAKLNILGSHDKERILTALSDVDDKNMSDGEKRNYKLDEQKLLLATRRLKVLSTLQFTITGVPCIYYGDEVGVEGFKDPYNRATFPWGNENEDLLEHYKSITNLRSNNDCLKKGDIKLFSIGEHVFGYLRQYKDKFVYCLFNRAIFDNEICHIELDIDEKHVKYIDDFKNLLKTENDWKIENNKIISDLKPLSFIVIGN